MWDYVHYRGRELRRSDPPARVEAFLAFFADGEPLRAARPVRMALSEGDVPPRGLTPARAEFAPAVRPFARPLSSGPLALSRVIVSSRCHRPSTASSSAALRLMPVASPEAL
jgi:hypothetical protein